MPTSHSKDGITEVREHLVRTGPTDEIRILGFFAILIRRWRTIAVTTLALAVVAVLMSLALPSSYTAQVLLVPASAVQGSGGALGAAGRAQGIAQLLGEESPQPDRLLGVVLHSHTLADSMVQRLGGDSVPEEQQRLIRQMLKGRTSIVKVEGGLQLKVSGHDPKFVTRVANLLPILANELISGLSTQAAARRGEFLEGQLASASEQLATSEKKTVEFQTAQSAPEIQEQAKRTMDVAAQLQQQILAEEIRIDQLRRTATVSNPEFQAEVAKLNGLRRQLATVTSGDRGNSKVLLSFKDSPELQAAATRLLRDYQLDEQVYTALANALAQAQVDAHNNLPVVTVLDAAIPPEHPDGLGLPLVLVLSMVTGLVIGAGLAVAREYAASARRDAGNAEFFVAWEKMKQDLSQGVPLLRSVTRANRDSLR